jgi:hypothetical protein
MWGQVMVVDPAAGTTNVVASDHDAPSFSRIVVTSDAIYAGETSSLYRLAKQGDGATQLFDRSPLALTADGSPSTTAFAAIDDLAGGFELYMLSSTADPVLLIHATDGWPGQIAADASYVYWSNTSGVYWVGRQAGAAREQVVADLNIGKFFVQGGEVIWMEAGGLIIHAVPASGGTPRIVLSMADLRDFDVDATRIYWMTVNDVEQPDYTYKYYGAVGVVDRATGAITTIATGEGVYQDVFADGGRAYWVRDRELFAE